MQDFLGDCHRSMSQKVCGDIGAIVTRGYLETLASEPRVAGTPTRSRLRRSPRPEQLSRKQNCASAMLLKGAATAALHAFELLMTTWRTMSEDLFNGALKRQFLLGRSPSKTRRQFSLCVNAGNADLRSAFAESSGCGRTLSHSSVPHICFWHKWVTGAVHSSFCSST